MKRSSACIQVVANQAGIPFSKAQSILIWMAQWDLPLDDEQHWAGVARIIGAMAVLETLGASNTAINNAMAAINRES